MELFKIILPYVPEKIDRKKNPLRVIEVTNNKLVKTSLFEYTEAEEELEEEYYDDDIQATSGYYESDEEEDEEDYYCSNYDDEEDDDWEDDSYSSYEDDDDRQPFCSMDVANTDWNTCDVNNIIW